MKRSYPRFASRAPFLIECTVNTQLAESGLETDNLSPDFKPEEIQKLASTARFRAQSVGGCEEQCVEVWGQQRDVHLLDPLIDLPYYRSVRYICTYEYMIPEITAISPACLSTLSGREARPVLCRAPLDPREPRSRSGVCP